VKKIAPIAHLFGQVSEVVSKYSFLKVFKSLFSQSGDFGLAEVGGKIIYYDRNYLQKAV
jgi:hypothetical protein